MPKLNGEFVFTPAAIRNLQPGWYRDGGLRHLFLRVGANPKRRNAYRLRPRPQGTFYFQFEARRDGKRLFVSKRLANVYHLDDARRAARILLGQHEDGGARPGPRQAITLDMAAGYLKSGRQRASASEFPEGSYLRHLTDKAAAAGKPATWAREVHRLYAQHIHPKWGASTLAYLSSNTGRVRQWHVELTRTTGPVSANHAARIMRAIYRHKARESEHKLSMADLPTLAVKMNKEKPREVDMTPFDFRQWANDVASIKSPLRRSLHVAMLLSGARPGELSRAKWSDLRLHERVLLVPKGKASAVVFVLSWPLVRCLRAARDWAQANAIVSPFIFPAREGGRPGTGHRASRERATQWRGHIKQWHGDGLAFVGNQLRHSYATIAAGYATAVDFDLLTQHGPASQSAEYVGRQMRARQHELREAQRRISRRLLALLGDDALKCLETRAPV